MMATSSPTSVSQLRLILWSKIRLAPGNNRPAIKRGKLEVKKHYNPAVDRCKRDTKRLVTRKKEEQVRKAMMQGHVLGKSIVKKLD
jgi:hypothetical protein